MILFINVFLTSKRFSTFDRGLLEDVDALAAFRYMLHSLTDIRFSQAFIFAELDPDNYPPEAAAQLETEVATLFAGTPLTFRPQRLLKLGDWRSFLTHTLLPADQPVFYSGNHDHVFLDSNTVVLEGCLNRLKQLRAQHGRVSLIVSHWAEYYSYRVRLQHQEALGFIHTAHYRDAMQILTPELLKEWFFDDCPHADPSVPIRRTEDLGWVGKAPFLQIIPGKEQFRHLDAGSHFGVRVRHVPPLRPPAGLLEGQLRIAYLARPDIPALRHYRDAGYCCISPCLPAAATDPDGVDFQCLFSDIPAFLLRNARDVVRVGPDTPENDTARDQWVANMLQDLLPVTPATLAQLAPLATQRRDYTEPLRLNEPAGGSRRTEQLFALKAPVGHRAAAVVVISPHPRVEHASFWSSLDRQNVHPVYIWQQERQNNSWHVQASAVHLGGEQYPLLSGLYAYHFDFAANGVTPLRRLLPELPCEQVVLVQHHALALPHLGGWIQQHAIRENSLLLGQQGAHETPLVLSIRRDWLDRLLAHEPQLYAPEILSTADVLLHAAKAHNQLPTLIVHRCPLPDTHPAIPRQPLLRWNPTP